MALTLPTDLHSDRHVWEAFQYHSRTFSMAARLLPRGVRQPVATLYLFCRTVDNVADERVLDVGPERALDEVLQMRADLEATLTGRPPAHFMWQRLARVHAAFDLTHAPLYELIDGAVWDLEGRPIETRSDLIDYSNLVGGSVGAMMLPFLLERRADFTRAEGPARALGIAMQITNIVRDVGEDRRRRGRLYLPRTMLRTHGLRSADLGGPGLPDGYPALLEAVMGLAEEQFEKGLAGINLLPARMRPGIRAAARMYREINNEVRARHYDSLTYRAYVPWWRKCMLVLRDAYTHRRDRLRSSRPITAPSSVAQPS